MIRDYPEIDPVLIERQGQHWIFCDHSTASPPVREGVKYVDESMVGKARPGGGEWTADDIGVIYDRGKVVKEGRDGKQCDASAQVVPEEREFQQGRVKGTILFAPLPEGWASSSENALDGAADFCPKHADHIYVVPEDEAEPPPIVEG